MRIYILCMEKIQNDKKNVNNQSLNMIFFPFPTYLFLFSALILSQGLWIVTGLLWEHWTWNTLNPLKATAEKSDKGNPGKDVRKSS